MPTSLTDLIECFAHTDTEAVVALWQACDLVVPWNDPHVDIARKLAKDPELFLVGRENGELVATAMGGYEGHRGWVNYLAVADGCRNRSWGRRMMDAIEKRLYALGCPKVNLQVRSTSAGVIGFYESLGYTRDDVVSLGKCL